jgi:NAD-dependent deacetylase
MLSLTMRIPDDLIESLRAARHVMVLSGAGISAESGLATFRTPQTGLWERFRPEELATPEAFRRDPGLVWGWYEWRRMQVMRAMPNPAHKAVAELQSLVPELTLVTQNVDDLHERAGSQHVIHLHGRIGQPYCETCRRPYALGPEIPDEPDNGRCLEPPACAHCAGRIRPGVVWFGESLPTAEWEAAQGAASRCDVFFCIGTSSVVQPAASLVNFAMRAGAVTVQVNPNPTGLESHVTCEFPFAAGAVLPGIIARLRESC